MTLKFIDGTNGKRRPWFPPDRIGRFRHDCPYGVSMTVYDVNGEAVCGRVVPGATELWVHRLEDWILDGSKPA
jgi:hypothetical protein